MTETVEQQKESFEAMFKKQTKWNVPPESYKELMKFALVKAYAYQEENADLLYTTSSDGAMIKGLVRGMKHDERNIQERMKLKDQRRGEILRRPDRDKRGFSPAAIKYLAIMLTFGGVLYVLQTNPRYLQLLELYMTQYGLHIIASAVLLAGLFMYLIMRRRRRPSE